MTHMGIPHCVPAFGRDYSSQAQVVEAWLNNVDFQMQPSGSYINRTDAEKYDAHEVNLRWNKREQVCVMTFTQVGLGFAWHVNGKECKQTTT